MRRDVQPRNPTPKKNLYAFNILSVSKRVEGEGLCVTGRQADELSVQGDEVTAQLDGVLQDPVHHNLSGPCSHLSSDTHTNFNFSSISTL